MTPEQKDIYIGLLERFKDVVVKNNKGWRLDELAAIKAIEEFEDGLSCNQGGDLIQLRETFQEAVTNDPDMTPEQKEYWLSKSAQPSGQQTEKWDCPCGEADHINPEFTACPVCGLPRRT